KLGGVDSDCPLSCEQRCSSGVLTHCDLQWKLSAVKQVLTRKDCRRCDHRWWPSSPKRPNVCPKCKRRNWDQPRRRVGRPVTTGADLRREDRRNKMEA